MSGKIRMHENELKIKVKICGKKIYKEKTVCVCERNEKLYVNNTFVRINVEHDDDDDDNDDDYDHMMMMIIQQTHTHIRTQTKIS